MQKSIKLHLFSLRS